LGEPKNTQDNKIISFVQLLSNPNKLYQPSFDPPVVALERVVIPWSMGYMGRVVNRFGLVLISHYGTKNGIVQYACWLDYAATDSLLGPDEFTTSTTC
jgi:hypothetical protein